ncbi:MAG: phosphotransferase enzyme family protein [Bacillota bacterium]
MRDNLLLELLCEYGIEHPQFALLKHNENMTYKVINPVDGNAYLLRIHQPVTANMAGLQHSYDGLRAELQMLKEMAEQTNLIVQTPVLSRTGAMITEIVEGDRNLFCSLLKWIDGRDLKKEELSNEQFARGLGTQTAKLHQFMRGYNSVRPGDRPNYGVERSGLILQQISRGVEKGLFGQTEYRIVEESVQLISARLDTSLNEPDAWGIIHADLNMSNVLVTEQQEFAFIDFGLFGYGFYLLDVAMITLNAPSEYRGYVLEGYFGEGKVPEQVTDMLGGFMLMAVLGYYAFQMENEKIHPWIHERMPLLCENRCRPLLNGESIFYSF